MFPLLGFSMGFWDCPNSMEFFPSFIRIELVVIFKYIYIRQKTTNNLCILQYFSSWYFYFLFFVRERSCICVRGWSCICVRGW